MFKSSYGNKCDPSETDLGEIKREIAESNMADMSIPRTVKSILPDNEEFAIIAVHTVNTTVITEYGA